MENKVGLAKLYLERLKKRGHGYSNDTNVYSPGVVATNRVFRRIELGQSRGRKYNRMIGIPG